MNKIERQSREQALLDTALACFNTDQWENVSVAAIAASAGVAKGTVYLHFASKHEIYARLALQFYSDLLAECLDLPSSDGRTQLKLLISKVFRQYQERREYRRITQYCLREDFIQNLNPELAQSLINTELQFQSVLRTILERGTKDGSWETNAVEKMPGIYYTIKGALSQLCCNNNTEQESQIECTSTITNYILSSVGPRIKNNNTTNTSHLTLDLVLDT